MKVVVFVPADKRSEKGELVLTDKKIGDFEVKEPKFLALKGIDLIAKERFEYDFDYSEFDAQKNNTKDIKVKSVNVNRKKFIEFSEAVLNASGLSEDDIVKYGFNNADIALEQIYLAWTKDVKK